MSLRGALRSRRYANVISVAVSVIFPGKPLMRHQFKYRFGVDSRTKPAIYGWKISDFANMLIQEKTAE